MGWKYLLSDVDLGEEEAQAVADVVRSKWLSTGPRTQEFETAFAGYLGAKHAVLTSSCTSALHLALASLGITSGDEVLVPSYTFVASANSILYQGATPVFVDIAGPDDLNLDLEDMRRKITPRTKAIVVVHMAGFPADMDAIRQIATEHQISIVEDACHAIGARFQGANELNGSSAGTLGDVGCFSFFANKNLVTGEGGMLVTNNDELAANARVSRSHGMNRNSWDKANGRATGYDVDRLGYNYRGNELTAALGLVQLRKLDQANETRKQLVKRYRERLAHRSDLVIPFEHRFDDSAHHLFAIVLNDASLRDEFRNLLAARGVQTSVHYPPVHRFSHFQPWNDGSLFVTEQVSAAEVTLPLHPLLVRADIDVICDEVEASLDDVAVEAAAR